MKYFIKDIASAIGENNNSFLPAPDDKINHLLTDSRSLTYPEDSLFFAIVTKAGDGHHFIPELYQSGVRNFVVSKLPEEWLRLYKDANFIVVSDTTDALRKLTAAHRNKFNIPVVGITGSRGKTTVKEWLASLLADSETVLRSPRSYNSHIGLPLSLWELEPSVSLAIFEAGISQNGEMKLQEETLNPTITVITSLGHEHDAGFSSIEEKAREKVQLAKHSDWIVYPSDDSILAQAVKKTGAQGKIFDWSRKDSNASLYVVNQVDLGSDTEIEYIFDGKKEVITVPFTKAIDVDNVITCLTFLHAYGLDADTIQARISKLTPVDTRLEVIEGVNNCMLMLDGYTSDLRSLAPALDHMCRTRTQNRSMTVILSDLIHEKKDAAALYKEVASLISHKNIDKFIGIGEEISAYRKYFDGDTRFFNSTDEMLAEMSTSDFDHEQILIKGRPDFEFAKIANRLEARQHETVLEVNLDAMMSNYNFFKSFLRPTTGIVAMVKASGYGAGSYELAKALQSAGASYLAVAAHDEGVDLRNAGITMPIMVLNPKVVNYPSLFANALEPEIYSFDVLKEIINEAQKCGITDYPVHIKIDSGMHRLGFLKDDIPALCSLLVSQDAITPKSVFSHLCAADDPAEDEYTQSQFEYFNSAWQQIQDAFPDKKVMRHILNSTGIVRFPEHQYDMVRLGIGLYGIETLTDGSMSALRPVSNLRSVIISLKDWPEGTTIGYNRRGVLKRNSRIATIPVGYADGIDRHFGCGHAEVSIKGHRCPTVGNICMDLCMIDVTDVPDVKVGDYVEIFGQDVTAAELAQILGTIPYEILTSVSPRVKRIYYRE